MPCEVNGSRTSLALSNIRLTLVDAFSKKIDIDSLPDGQKGCFVEPKMTLGHQHLFWYQGPRKAEQVELAMVLVQCAGEQDLIYLLIYWHNFLPRFSPPPSRTS